MPFQNFEKTIQNTQKQEENNSAKRIIFLEQDNEFLPIELLKAEMQKRDYLLQKAEMDDTWKGGNLVVPFEGQNA